MDIVARAKAILLTPKTEWLVIEAEATSVQDIYQNYLIYLAAIPAIAQFIGMSIIGISMPVIGTIRAPFFSGLIGAIVGFILNLVGVYLLALITDKLAPTFNGTPNFLNAFKLAAYSLTASMLVGIFAIIPALSILGILGLYSLYLFYIGLPILMKSPPDKSLIYTVAVIVAGIVIFGVIGFIVSRIMLP